MRATSSTRHQRLRTTRFFRVGLSTLIASSGLVVALMFSTTSANADSLTVMNCNSSGPGSLAGVVANAAADSLITFSLTCSTIPITSPIDFTVPLTIDGPGASALQLDGPQSGDQVMFNVDSDVDVSVSALSIQNEYLGITNEGTLTLSDCAMQNDPSQQQVEAIENDGTLAVDNCTMTGNGANLNDDFSLGIDNEGTASLSGCTMKGFESNFTGGAAVDNEGQLTISACIFKKNVGHFGGAAIESGGGSVAITSSRISDNEAINSTGDSIDNDAGTMVISDSTVSHNNGTGGISNAGTLSVADSSVSSNDVDGGVDNTGTLNVTGSVLSHNVGVGIDNGGGSVTVTGSEISKNFDTNKRGGGGIYNGKGTMNIADTSVSDNKSNNGPGGGIYNGGTMSLADSTVSSNSNEGGGGGIDNVGSLHVSDSTISENTVGGPGGEGGGGILNQGSGASLVVAASTLAHNDTDNHGGGIKNARGSVTLAGTVVADTSPSDCTGLITDAGYNLDDDGSCGFSAGGHSYSDVAPYLGPLQNNGGPTDTEEPALGSPLLSDIPAGTSADGVTLCPGTDQRGVARPQGSQCDIGAVELSPTPQDITSSNNATATVRQPFSFMVTTTGAPTPKLSETGAVPRKLVFTENGDGTATISGRAKKVGSSDLVIEAAFGSGSGRYVVLQVLTLTVVPG
jgi:hypothetical protein